MTVPALDSTTAALPLGRFRVAEQEVHDAFVTAPAFAASATRSAIWSEYQDARDLLQSAVRVHAAWFGGSFITAKLDPSDIDVVFLVSERDYIRTSPDNRKIVNSFNPRRNAVGAVVRDHGLKLVDSYILNWRPHPSISPNSQQVPADAAQYCATRGYWDDFWQRQRSGGKLDPPIWKDAIPAQGYLEVEFDVFTR